jgi:hypothetical protein
VEETYVWLCTKAPSFSFGEGQEDEAQDDLYHGNVVYHYKVPYRPPWAENLGGFNFEF